MIFKIRIRTKILTVFLALSLISLTLFGYLAINHIKEVGNYALRSSSALGDRAVSNSTNALETQAEEYMLRLAMDQATISNALFEKVEGEVHTTVRFAADLWNNRSSPGDQPSYPQEETPEDVYAVSVYVLAPGVNANEVRKELRLWSNLNKIFIPIHANDPNLTWIYIGTESGILQLYPWVSGIDPSFDPRVRTWYTKAKETGQISWSEPYIDVITGSLMISCSKPVYDSKHNLIGVIAVDVTTKTINQKIINLRVGELGYAFLMDNSGKIIAHPGSSSGDQKWDETFEAENMLHTDNLELRKIAKNMTIGKIGIARCKFEDGIKYIAYAPITSTNWSIGVVMPVKEIIAPALATKSQIFSITRSSEKGIERKTKNIQNTLITMFIGMIVVVSGVSFLLSRAVTRPLTALTKGAKIIGKGELEHKVKVKTGDELEELANSFNEMALDLKKHIDELQRTTAEKERLQKELEIANDIQQSFLPRSVPKIKGVELAAFNLPAREVGGDFYDFIPITIDKWGLTIADVSGKGIPAALFMALSRTLVRASTTRNPAAAEAIMQANKLIFEDSQSTDMFVTLFYAILDSTKKSLRYVNAGHNPPLLIRETPGDIVLLKAKGIALGVIDNIELEETEIELTKGDVVVLYTDGVTEAISENKERFEQERLTKVITKNRNSPAQDILKEIKEELLRFAGKQPQFDDITLMILKVT